MKLLILFIFIPILNGCAATYMVNEKSEDGYLSYVQAHKMSSANNSNTGELLLCFEGVYNYIVSTGPTRGNIVLAQYNSTESSKKIETILIDQECRAFINSNNIYSNQIPIYTVKTNHGCLIDENCTRSEWRILENDRLIDHGSFPKDKNMYYNHYALALFNKIKATSIKNNSVYAFEQKVNDLTYFDLYYVYNNEIKQIDLGRGVHKEGNAAYLILLPVALIVDIVTLPIQIINSIITLGEIGN